MEVKRRNLRSMDIRPLTDSICHLPLRSYFICRRRNRLPWKLARRNYFRDFKIPKFQNFGFGEAQCDTPGLEWVKSKKSATSGPKHVIRQQGALFRCHILHADAEISPVEVGARKLFPKFRNFEISKFRVLGGNATRGFKSVTSEIRDHGPYDL